MDTQASIIKGDGSSNDDLIDAVLQQFEDYDPNKLIWAETLLYEIYRCILRSGGSNNFQILHTHVNSRQLRGEDPVDTFVSGHDRLTGEMARDALENGVPVEYPEEPPEEEDEENDAEEDAWRAQKAMSTHFHIKTFVTIQISANNSRIFHFWPWSPDLAIMNNAFPNNHWRKVSGMKWQKRQNINVTQKDPHFSTPGCDSTSNHPVHPESWCLAIW